VLQFRALTERDVAEHGSAIRKFVAQA
jgi:hypothetical protein